jgi:hypothetical protein
VRVLVCVYVCVFGGCLCMCGCGCVCACALDMVLNLV